jgi:hypothetical protein
MWVLFGMHRLRVLQRKQLQWRLQFHECLRQRWLLYLQFLQLAVRLEDQPLPKFTVPRLQVLWLHSLVRQDWHWVRGFQYGASLRHGEPGRAGFVRPHEVPVHAAGSTERWAHDRGCH